MKESPRASDIIEKKALVSELNRVASLPSEGFLVRIVGQASPFIPVSASAFGQSTTWFSNLPRGQMVESIGTVLACPECKD